MLLGVYIHIFGFCPANFFLKSTLFQRKLVGQNLNYMNIHPPVSILAMALLGEGNTSILIWSMATVDSFLAKHVQLFDHFKNTLIYGTVRDYTKFRSDVNTKVWLLIGSLVKRF